jgi:hypothetical protein
MDAACTNLPTPTPIWCNRPRSSGWYEHKKAFLRGGIWKNFFSRYPESNWMHKRMLGLVFTRLANALPEKYRISC